VNTFNKNTLVVFGDSNVWGAELKDVPHRQPDFKSVVYDPKDIDNWPYHIRHSFSGVIAEKNNMRILNLSIPGCSNDTIFRRINKFLQGNYPVDLDDCFVMVFWTGILRREFFRSDINKYLNYSPLWEEKLQLFPKFHKIYSKLFMHEGYDLVKSFNYLNSVNALLTYNNVEFCQGFSLMETELIETAKNANLPKFLSFDPNDAITAMVIIAGNGFENNDYILEGHHPSEKGHQLIANRFTELLDKLV